jgi:hypothetical protein
LAIKLNVQKLEDWNKVTHDMVMKAGGYFIGDLYNNSVAQGTPVMKYSDFDKLYKHSILIINQ